MSETVEPDNLMLLASDVRPVRGVDFLFLFCGPVPLILTARLDRKLLES